MRNVFLILIGVLFALGANAQSGTFNQCRGGSTGTADCDGVGSTDPFVGPDFEVGETFKTNFDVQFPLNPNRCRFSWEAYFPEQCIGHQSWQPNYNPVTDDVDCFVSLGENPPAGVPSQNTGRLFCRAIDTDLTDLFPLRTGPSSQSDIIHTWEVLDGCDPEGEDVVISAGNFEFYFEFSEGQCLLSDDGRMQTDITLSVAAEPVPDTDGDLIPDNLDTCTLVQNATDCDSDIDGYGNKCDGDFNNDGLHTGGDINPFIAALQASDSRADQNCDGLLTGADISPFIQTLEATPTPGPSGLSCAGTIPCQ